MHERIGGFRRVIDAAAGRIPSVQGVSCRFICRICNGFVKLTVYYSGEGTVLINDSGEGVRKRRVFYSIENNRAYGYLTGVRFASGFG